MDSGIEFENLNEFLAKLDSISNEYATTAEKHLRKTGNRLRKTVIAATPDGSSSDTVISKSGKTRKNRKKLKNSWKGTIKGESGDTLEYDLRSTAPHFHLVDRGHVQKTPSGRVTGFVAGKHFFDKAVKEWEATDDVSKELEKYMQEIKKKVDDN